MIRSDSKLGRRLFCGLLVAAAIATSWAVPAQAAPSKHYVLVHGAAHGAWTWYKIATLLNQAGHSVTSVDLPAHGIDGAVPGGVTLGDYAQAVIDRIDAIEGQVILVGHSMGGIVISTVAEARPDKIEKLVYLAAFLLTDGTSLFDVFSQDVESLVLQNLIVDPDAGTADVDRSQIREIFYNTSPPSDVTLASVLLRPEPLIPLVTPLVLTPERFGSVRRFYVTTLQDQAITPPTQEMMYTQTPVERVYQMNTDHSPFFSRPLQLLLVLLDIGIQ